jgi:membrane-bound lytic murein transglycosylase D
MPLACVTGKSNLSGEKEAVSGDLVEDAQDSAESPLSELETPLPAEIEHHEAVPILLDPTEKSPVIPDQAPPIESDQKLLDSALEFCQASYDYWDRGDLDNALDALDQAYSLILRVNPSPKDLEILQQRDDLRFTISKRIIECYSARFTVANGYHKAIPLEMNEHVEKALRLFKGRERQFFLEAYRRSGRYRPAIVKALEAAGLPEELSWLPLIESGFKIRAFSRARALGMWQFIASTGYKFGLKRDRWVDERMDPEKSTKAAIAYLKELHQIFGDWATALAAYNCGEGAVLKRIRTQRINYLDNFWDLYRKLPLETAFYYPKFMAVLHILNDPEAHGFTLPTVDSEIEKETVAINKQVHLKTVAKHLDVAYGTMRDLNPELRYNYTPERPYPLNVPKGKGVSLLAKIDDIPVWHPPQPAYVVHRVRSGESLSLIATKYRTSVRAIMAMNRLRSRHYIKAGWKLKVPVKRRYASAKKAPLPIYALQVKGSSLEYVVQKGDSLWKIANHFGTKAEIIQALNHLNTTRLDVGQVLKIPKGPKTERTIKSIAKSASSPETAKNTPDSSLHFP